MAFSQSYQINKFKNIKFLFSMYLTNETNASMVLAGKFCLFLLRTKLIVIVVFVLLNISVII